MDNRRRKKSAFFWSIITHIVHMLYKIELQKKEYTKTSFHYGLTMNSTVVWYPIRLHRCFFSSFLIISNGVKQWMKMEKEKKKKEKHSNLRITTTTKQKKAMNFFCLVQMFKCEFMQWWWWWWWSQRKGKKEYKSYDNNPEYESIGIKLWLNIQKTKQNKMIHELHFFLSIVTVKHSRSSNLIFFTQSKIFFDRYFNLTLLSCSWILCFQRFIQSIC